MYSREKAILLLRLFSEFLKTNELSEKVIFDIVETIKNYRQICVNIVDHFHKIREFSSYHVGAKKYNLKSLFKLFNYDCNYLVKVSFVSVIF